MKTNKSISNIAYMLPVDFEANVRRLQEKGMIGTCFWVCHKGEGKDKDHIHFILLGGEKTYNTNGLSDLFGFSIFPDGSQGSVTKCWCPSKRVEDWILYSIHDKLYLLKKCEKKEHYYTFSNINCGQRDKETLNIYIQKSEHYRDYEMMDKVYQACKFAVDENMTWHDVIISGLIPVNCLGGAYQVYDEMQAEKNKKKSEIPIDTDLDL